MLHLLLERLPVKQTLIDLSTAERNIRFKVFSDESTWSVLMAIDHIFKVILRKETEFQLGNT